MEAAALRLARAERSARSCCSRLPWNATLNSSLCNLKAMAASSDWLGPILLLKLLVSLSVTWEEAWAAFLLMLLLLMFVLLLFCSELLLWVLPPGGVAATALLLFRASTSSGNRSWIVFHSTVFMVQDLALLQQWRLPLRWRWSIFCSSRRRKSSGKDYLISCLHFGHRFPHLLAADFKHLMQKLRIRMWSLSVRWCSIGFHFEKRKQM